MAPKQNIIIIGGGYGGIQVSKELEKLLSETHQLILIERKSHFWNAMASARAMAEDGFYQKLFIPYDTFFQKGGKVVHATVTSIEKNQVIVDRETEWGTSIPFNYLVIATGSDYPTPGKINWSNRDEAAPHIRAQREAVKKAKKVLVIGGGSTGIELAGEIVSAHKDKEVTLVHAHKTLLGSNSPKKLTNTLKCQLEDVNVKLILGEKIIFPEGGIDRGLSPQILYTDHGTKIESDVQFVTIGSKPNSALTSTLDPSLLEDDTKLVKVIPTLQLDHPDYKHIFAIGDITNIKETKLAFRARLHGDIVAKNIKALVTETELKRYKPPSEIIAVTTSRTTGAELIPIFEGIVAGNFLIRNLKGKNLCVDHFWNEITGTRPLDYNNCP